MSSSLRTNRQIRGREVRVIAEDGTNLGILSLTDALAAADEAGLDLVEVSPSATPPVCRITDASKLAYLADQKERAARRAHTPVLKELKFRLVIDDHDYATKLAALIRFLAKGHPVKVTVMLRGRERGRPESAELLLDRIAADVAAAGTRQGKVSNTGRDVIVTFAPATR